MALPSLRDAGSFGIEQAQKGVSVALPAAALALTGGQSPLVAGAAAMAGKGISAGLGKLAPSKKEPIVEEQEKTTEEVAKVERVNTGQQKGVFTEILDTLKNMLNVMGDSASADAKTAKAKKRAGFLAMSDKATALEESNMEKVGDDGDGIEGEDGEKKKKPGFFDKINVMKLVIIGIMALVAGIIAVVPEETWKKIDSMLKDLGTWFKDKLVPILETIWEWLKDVGFPAGLKALKKNWESLKKMFSGLGDAFKEIGDGNILTGLTSIVKVISTFLLDVIDNGLTALAEMFGVKFGKGESVFSKLGDFFANMVDNIISWIRDSFPDAIVDKIFGEETSGQKDKRLEKSVKEDEMRRQAVVEAEEKKLQSLKDEMKEIKQSTRGPDKATGKELQKIIERRRVVSRELNISRKKVKDANAEGGEMTTKANENVGSLQKKVDRVQGLLDGGDPNIDPVMFAELKEKLEKAKEHQSRVKRVRSKVKKDLQREKKFDNMGVGVGADLDDDEDFEQIPVYKGKTAVNGAGAAEATNDNKVLTEGRQGAGVTIDNSKVEGATAISVGGDTNVLAIDAKVKEGSFAVSNGQGWE